MNALHVTSSSHNYKIIIGEDKRFHLAEYLEKDYSAIMIITDDVVASLYLDDIVDGLGDKTVHQAIIPHGEASKDITNYYAIQTKAMEYGLDRNALIIALGGGVVGDLAGFVAATYMRGIDYIQVPTTILAHDSSVGGKVAINHALGKNMIGSFYPPVAVVYDVNTLSSLPEHEVRSGYAELIKEAFIANEPFLKTLFQVNLADISNESLVAHLYEGIKIKADIVQKDERESYLRKFLNLGHTLGHALETELGYGKVTHGEAVAIGILFAIRVSEGEYDITLPYDALYTWLKQNDYPLSLFDVELDNIIKIMKSDKKSESQQVQMVLLEKLAKPEVAFLTDEKLKAYLQSFREELSDK